MRPTVLRTYPPHSNYNWLRVLHCLYAGLFAFVLPFICWGAQATPGHPHALAHFVFLAPPLQASVLLTATNAKPIASVGLDHAAHQAAQKVAEQPVGRSEPSLLLISTLLLIGLTWTLMPSKGNEPTFSRWLTQPVAIAVTSVVPTPPPR